MLRARINTLLRHPWVPWIVAAAFVVAELAAIHAEIFLNSEGILTWIFAGLTRESTVDMLFFQKARPPISLLYAPVAALGLRPFFWAHALFAALAIPLSAGLARRFNHKYPNLPAALVAFSPLYFAGGASGVQNTDGTVGLLAAAWLMARKEPMAAGLVLGVVILGRVEISFFALALVAFAVLTPGYRRLPFGMLIFPAVYTLCGALYHGDVLWVLHYPQTIFRFFEAARCDDCSGTLNDLVTTVIGLMPAAGVLVWPWFRGRWSLENTLGIAAIAFVFMMRFLPFTQRINADVSPRYVLPALPFLCVAASRAVAEWGGSWRESSVRGVLLIGVASLVLPWLASPVQAVVCTAIVACLIPAALAFVSKRAAAVTLAAATAGMMMLAVTAAEVFPLLSSSRLVLGDQAKQLDDCVRWIAAAHAPVVVTDEALLATWLAEQAPTLQVDVRFLVPPDMLKEVRTLTNPATHQFQTIFGTSRFAYAHWIFVDQITSLPGDVLFVMRNDPARAWTRPPMDRVEWLVKGDWLGGRLMRDSSSPTRAAGP